MNEDKEFTLLNGQGTRKIDKVTKKLFIKVCRLYNSCVIVVDAVEAQNKELLKMLEDGHHLKLLECTAEIIGLQYELQAGIELLTKYTNSFTEAYKDIKPGFLISRRYNKNMESLLFMKNASVEVHSIITQLIEVEQKLRVILQK